MRELLLFRIENSVLDRRQLTCGGETVLVKPKVFDLLPYLIENRDRLSHQGQFDRRGMGGRIVSDSALTSAVNAARKAVGGCGREQRLIRTSPSVFATSRRRSRTARPA